MAIGATQRLGKEAILATLAQADECAQADGDLLTDKVGEWVERVSILLDEKCPKSYLPVLSVLLVARAMRPKDELDVLAVAAKAGSKGYSAQSIGGHLARFAHHRDIDLRSRSSQPMNNQPFTNEKFITASMSGDQYAPFYAKFYENACLVQELSPDVALSILAYIFHIRRGVGREKVHAFQVQGGRAAFVRLVAETNDFVASHSDRGKVGQAFAAALYDILYGPEQVRMGKNHDPSFSVAGDVQVGPDPDFWLYAEVKQTAITTSEVTGFMHRVAEAGGERVSYFALANHRYPEQLSISKAKQAAGTLGIELEIYQSPDNATAALLAYAPGTFGQVASSLASRLSARLHEAQVANSVSEAWQVTLSQFT